MFICKKAKPSTLTDGYYETSIHSFTKDKTRITVIVSKEFLSEEDTVLIIDDFLANGDASLGLYDIAQQAILRQAGIGIVVEKSFQNGHQRLEEAGLTVSSLCKVASLEGNKVTLVEKIMKNLILSVQHLLAMHGAILIPIIVGTS